VKKPTYTMPTFLLRQCRIASDGYALSMKIALRRLLLNLHENSSQQSAQRRRTTTRRCSVWEKL